MLNWEEISDTLIFFQPVLILALKRPKLRLKINNNREKAYLILEKPVKALFAMAGFGD